MGREKLATEVRREQIAGAALEILARAGPKGLSVGAVARRLGLVPSAIYRHFGGKDEMVAAALAQFRDRMLENVRAVRAESPVALERLEGLLDRHVRMIRDNIAMPRVVFSDDACAPGSAGRARVAGNLKAYLDGVAGIIREGQSAGELRRDAEPATLAVMFLGLIMPAAILWHLTEGGFDVTRHAAQSWKVFRRAVVNDVNSGSRKRGAK